MTREMDRSEKAVWITMERLRVVDLLHLQARVSEQPS